MITHSLQHSSRHLINSTTPIEAIMFLQRSALVAARRAVAAPVAMRTFTSSLVARKSGVQFDAMGAFFVD